MHAKTILRRWDAIAYSQLCEEAARLAEENEQLRQQLEYAEEAAAAHCDAWLAALESMGASPGLCVDGTLVAVPKVG